jgi:hypothetical protein
MADEGETKEPEATTTETNRGKITLTFQEDDTLSINYADMKPWKFWAAGKMLETLGDQMMIQAQMEQMRAAQQQAATMEALMRNPGGLRGPRQ